MNGIYAANTLNNLGDAYRKVGRHDDARRMYKQVLQLDPNHKGTSDNLISVATGTSDANTNISPP